MLFIKNYLFVCLFIFYKLIELATVEKYEELSYEDIDINGFNNMSELQDSTEETILPIKSSSKTYSPHTSTVRVSTEITSTTQRITVLTTESKIDSIIKCNTDGSYDGDHNIKKWPTVEQGQYSEADCPDGEGKVRWKCMETGHFCEKGPDFSNCLDWLDNLENISNIENVGKAIKVIEFISNKTIESNTIVKTEKLSKILDIISKVQTFVDKANDTDFDKLNTYTIHIVETFNHIMEQKQAWGNSNDKEKTSLASKILIGTQSSSYSLSLQMNANKSFVEINNNDFYINTFYTNSSSELRFPTTQDMNFSSIFIPPNTSFANTSISRNNTAIGAIIRNLNGYLSSNLDQNYEINSDILSFSLTNCSKRIQLNKDVIIRLKHRHKLEFGDKVECVFWDFIQSKWSSDGCQQMVNESDRLHTVCRCNHLTNFAALMDVNGRESKTLLKSLLTYICSIISIIGLIFTINLIIRSKNNSDLNSMKETLNEMRSIITSNLCICLLITNILVIAGMDRTNILWLCQLSSALLLYSLLSSFSWMLMEGYYLYKSLVSCFKLGFKSMYLYILGYGIPILILLVAFTVIYIKENILLEALFDERYNYFCWISSSHYPSHIWILIGPALCVIFCNCVLMYISLRTAYKILRNESSFGMNSDKTKIKFKQIISFVFILFLLGITWLSFLFYIHQFFSSVFAYVFIILNGSQGFFIFLYHLSIFNYKKKRRGDSTHSSSLKLF